MRRRQEEREMEEGRDEGKDEEKSNVKKEKNIYIYIDDGEMIIESANHGKK